MTILPKKKGGGSKAQPPEGEAVDAAAAYQLSIAASQVSPLVRYTPPPTNKEYSENSIHCGMLQKSEI
jgi:hypothetical protein